MKRKILLLLCLPAALFSQTIPGSFTHDGSLRNYFVHLPPNFQAAQNLPLVLNLHGYTSNASQQELYSEMNAVADTAHFVVCYPDGLNNQWNAFSNAGTDDVGFLSALIDSLHHQFGIDLDRVYSCGMSNGGFMSYRLACKMSDRITAIASVTGSMTNSMFDDCSLSRPVPVMQIHGTADGVVPYAGGTGIAAVEEVVAFWVDQNDCPDEPDTTDLPNVISFDQSTAQKITWAGCDGTSEVVFIKIENGGHTWPGAFPTVVLGQTNQDFEGSVEIWNFFRRFSLAETSGVSSGIEKQEVAMVFPNPFQDELNIEMSHGKASKASISDVLGAVVWQQNLAAGEPLTLPTAAWQPGIYLLALESAGEKVFFKLVKSQ